MAYWTGSEAVWLDGSAERQYQPQPSRTFEVFEGAGLDARAREGVSSSFVNAIKVMGLVMGLLIALAFGRVFISSATVSILKQNADARTDIQLARSERADLEVQRSVLSASARIDRIATQNLGMVLAPSAEQIDVSDLFPVQEDELAGEDAELAESGAQPAGDGEGDAPAAADGAGQALPSN